MKLNKKAFTLVEMLIVVVIIGILAAALLPKLMSAQGRARDTARKADLTQILTSLKMYYDDEGAYPTASATDGCVGDKFKALMEPYMSEVPSDPQKNRKITIGSSTACTKDYGYTDLKNSGTTAGAAMLAANLEVFGKSMNWVHSGSQISNTLDMKDLIKLKCTEWVFLSWSDGACNASDKKGWATDDFEWIYVVFPN